jgi:pilus assembly protein Flp/PilA
MLKRLRALARDRRGATAIEYGLIVSLIILSMMVALTNFATQSISMWNNISNKVAGAG